MHGWESVLGQPGWTAVHVPRALEETCAIATGCLQLNTSCSRIGVRCLATHARDASHWACHRSITFLFFFRRPPKKSKDYNVSILLGREKLREGIPFWLKAFEFASQRISNVWILLELRGCWPWSCANSSICCAASSICYPAAQAAAPFLRPCAAPTGLMPWTAWSDRRRGCSNPSFGDLKWILGSTV